MKKVVSLVFTLLLVGCIAVNAYATSGFDGKTQQDLESEAMVYRLFSKQYTVYGKNGVDITDAFYAVTTHNSCQNVHIIKNRPGKPGLPGFMPRYTGKAKRTTHVNATRKNAAFWGSTLHLGPMA